MARKWMVLGDARNYLWRVWNALVVVSAELGRLCYLELGKWLSQSEPEWGSIRRCVLVEACS